MEDRRYFELIEIYNLMFHENFPNMLLKNYSIAEQIKILEDCIKNNRPYIPDNLYENSDVDS